MVNRDTIEHHAQTVNRIWQPRRIYLKLHFYSTFMHCGACTALILRSLYCYCKFFNTVWFENLAGGLEGVPNPNPGYLFHNRNPIFYSLYRAVTMGRNEKRVPVFKTSEDSCFIIFLHILACTKPIQIKHFAFLYPTSFLHCNLNRALIKKTANWLPIKNIVWTSSSQFWD